MRVYTVPILGGTIPDTDAIDLWAITPADDKPIKILGVSLDNVGGVADAGDIEEELLGLAMHRGCTSVGSGGATPTPVPLNPADTAAGFTAHTLDTTPASGGTSTNPVAFGWNVRVPLREFWPDELQPAAGQGNVTIVVRMATGPADDLLVNGTLWVVELV